MHERQSRSGYELTENGDDHIVLHDFHGAVANVVNVGERIPFVDEVLPGRAEVVPDVQR